MDPPETEARRPARRTRAAKRETDSTGGDCRPPFELIPTPRRLRIISWAAAEFIRSVREWVPTTDAPEHLLVASESPRTFQGLARPNLTAANLAAALNPDARHTRHATACPAHAFEEVRALHGLLYDVLRRWGWSGTWEWRGLKRRRRGHIVPPLASSRMRITPEELAALDRLASRLPPLAPLPPIDVHTTKCKDCGETVLSIEQDHNFQCLHFLAEDFMAELGDEAGARLIGILYRAQLDPQMTEEALLADLGPDAARLIAGNGAKGCAGNQAVVLRPDVPASGLDAPAELPDLVTLDEAAAAVHRKKRALENYKKMGILPPPKVRGGGGKPALWDWKVIRPWLEANFEVGSLPEKFPGNRNR
jgi:hypothetical protein